MASIKEPDPQIALNRDWAEKAFSAGGGPFSLVYGGASSTGLIGSWTGADGGSRLKRSTRRRALAWTDPDTRLEIKAIVNVYSDTAGVDWTLFLTNRGRHDTPVVENPRMLDLTLPVRGRAVMAGDGLQFLVWFEPERLAAGTLIAREHPELVISPDGDGSGLFNLGIPAAREYMTRTLDAAIKEWKLGCIRFDFNTKPLGFWQHEDARAPDRVGIAEIRYIEGLYRMWDDLRAARWAPFPINSAAA